MSVLTKLHMGFETWPAISILFKSEVVESKTKSFGQEPYEARIIRLLGSRWLHFVLRHRARMYEEFSARPCARPSTASLISAATMQQVV